MVRTMSKDATDRTMMLSGNSVATCFPSGLGRLWGEAVGIEGLASHAILRSGRRSDDENVDESLGGTRGGENTFKGFAEMHTAAAALTWC